MYFTVGCIKASPHWKPWLTWILHNTLPVNFSYQLNCMNPGCREDYTVACRIYGLHILSFLVQTETASRIFQYLSVLGLMPVFASLSRFHPKEIMGESWRANSNVACLHVATLCLSKVSKELVQIRCIAKGQKRTMGLPNAYLLYSG